MSEDLMRRIRHLCVVAFGLLTLAGLSAPVAQAQFPQCGLNIAPFPQGYTVQAGTQAAVYNVTTPANNPQYTELHWGMQWGDGGSETMIVQAGGSYGFQHTFSAAGSYQPSMYVQGFNGAALTCDQTAALGTITVTGGAPPPPPPAGPLTVDFTYAPAQPQSGDTVTFTGSCSQGGQACGSGAQYSWNVNGVVQSGQTVGVRFGGPGGVTATLSVTYNNASQSVTKTFSVAATQGSPSPPPGQQPPAPPTAAPPSPDQPTTPAQPPSQAPTACPAARTAPVTAFRLTCPAGTHPAGGCRPQEIATGGLYPTPPCKSDADKKRWRLKAREHKQNLREMAALGIALGFGAAVPNPASVPAGIAAGISALVAFNEDYLVDVYSRWEADPPDPNFGTLSSPPVVRVLAVRRSRALSRSAARALNALLRSIATEVNLVDALTDAFERVQGAMQAGDAGWEARQRAAVSSYASRLAQLLRARAKLRSSARRALRASGFPTLTVNSSAIRRAQRRVRANGLPARVTREMARLGLSGPKRAGIQATFLSLNPRAVRRVSFPAVLTSRATIRSEQAGAAAWARLAAGIQPRVRFSPAVGRRGRSVVVHVSGFPPSRVLTIRMIRPNGQPTATEYTVAVGPRGSGSRAVRFFATSPAGIWSATVTDPASGAAATARLRVR